VKHMLKDIRWATEIAGDGALPLARAVREQLVRAAGDGLSEQDMASLIEVL